MTDWKKWDAIAAAVSSDEEDGAEGRAARGREASGHAALPPLVGVGAPLTGDGRVQPGAAGSARGNGGGANAPPPREVALTRFSWADGGDGEAVVTVPFPRLPPSASPARARAPSPAAADTVRCLFTPDSFTLTVVDGGGTAHTLRVAQLGQGCRGIRPEACSHSVVDAGGTAGAEVVLRLAKARSGPWPRLGTAEAPVVRPVVTVTSYRWSDEKLGVRIWISVPKVHTLPKSCVRVRFRELSFDVTVADLGGKDHVFSVTELPMEVVVAQCEHVVETDTVKVYLRKWARTGWHKLQLNR